MIAIRMVADLLTPADRRRFLSLLPAMVLSSFVDLAIVGGAAGFFALLTNPAALRGDGAAAALFTATGLDQRQFLVAVGLGVVALVLGGNAFSALIVRALLRFAWSQVTSIGERTLASHLHRPYTFFLTHSSPQLSHQVLVEVQSVVERIVVQATQTLSRTLGGVLVAGWLFWQEPGLTLLLVGALGLSYGLTYTFLRRQMYRLGATRSSANQTRHAVANESLTGIKEIKLHGLEAEALRRFRLASEEFASAMSTHASIAVMPRYTLESIAIGGMVLVVVYLLYTDRPVEGTLGLVGTYAIAAYRLLPSLQAAFAVASYVRFETAALSHIHQGIATAPRLTNVAPVEVPFTREVSLSGVTFRYPDTDRAILEGLNLTFRRGTWTALVGSTGSGKTTLVDLLMGLLAADEGELQVDGRPIRTAGELAGWQSRIGYVPQSIFMSDDTIAANVAFGQATPDRDRVVAAARLAAIDDFVERELPQRWDTSVGERGVRLSGGQRQRLGIARAIYRQPDLLVLDEATSALDNQTEARFVENLRAAYADTTVVMIAHRLSTTRYCDQILLLDRGRVLDRGTYDELLDRSPLFRQLVSAAATDPAPLGPPVAPPLAVEEPPSE
jgi:ABC-type multidrug transport system fused ATPase/permease subunit